MLIIKAVASLNYHDDQLLKNLKEYNYELFLSSLKFGCSSLGSYYKAVLDEVEASFVNDENRYYRQEDAPFKEVEIVQQQPSVWLFENLWYSYKREIYKFAQTIY